MTTVAGGVYMWPKRPEDSHESVPPPIFKTPISAVFSCGEVLADAWSGAGLRPFALDPAPAVEPWMEVWTV